MIKIIIHHSWHDFFHCVAGLNKKCCNFVSFKFDYLSRYFLLYTYYIKKDRYLYLEMSNFLIILHIKMLECKKIVSWSGRGCFYHFTQSVIFKNIFFFIKIIVYCRDKVYCIDKILPGLFFIEFYVSF